jgi:LytR cell envelope-related transcriptional attenuator/LytR_cpsA_psr family
VSAGRAARVRAMRRRRAAAVVGAVAIVAASAYGVARLGDAAGGGRATGGTGNAARPAELLALQVAGTADPLLALVGSGAGERPPTFFTVPFDLTMTVPGQGEARAAEVAGLQARTMRVAISNAFGVWASHYAVLRLDGLVAAVDRSGGIEVAVPGTYVTDAGQLGPGPQELSGEQVAALLGVRDGRGEARWAAVVQGVLGRSLDLQDEDLLESSGADGVRRALRASAGAGLSLFPTVSVASSVLVPRQPDLDREVARAFGWGSPVPVIVENGVGVPGLGEDVAAMLLPEGYRVVVSQNAEPFGYERTQVVANGHAALADARRIREALGVGRVGVSRVPSGIGDITIIVGEDFTG